MFNPFARNTTFDNILDESENNKLAFEEAVYQQQLANTQGINIHSEPNVAAQQIPGTPIFKNAIPGTLAGDTYNVFGQDKINAANQGANINNFNSDITGGFLQTTTQNQVTDEDKKNYLAGNDTTSEVKNKIRRDEERRIERSKSRLKQGKQGHNDTKKEKPKTKVEEEKDQRGFIKRQWDKFTDKDSTAPRNLLDFGMAMMANSQGAGDDFLGTTAKSVSDTIDKADARKLASLEAAKENRASKLDEAKTTSEIYESIVKQNTKDFTDGDTGTKYSETDWNQVAISLQAMDPDNSFYSKNYLANMVDNKIGMPVYDDDNGFQITMDGDNQEQGFKVNQEIQSVVAMHGEKTDAQKKKVKVTLNGTQTTLYDIMRSESYQKSLNKTDNQNVNVNNLSSEVAQGNLTADQKAWVASGGKLEDFVGY